MAQFTFKQPLIAIHDIVAETEEQAREILETNAWQDPDDPDSPIARSTMKYLHKDTFLDEYVDIKTSLEQAELIDLREDIDYHKELYNLMQSRFK